MNELLTLTLVLAVITPGNSVQNEKLAIETPYFPLLRGL